MNFCRIGARESEHSLLGHRNKQRQAGLGRHDWPVGIAALDGKINPRHDVVGERVVDAFGNGTFGKAFEVLDKLLAR